MLPRWRDQAFKEVRRRWPAKSAQAANSTPLNIVLSLADGLVQSKNAIECDDGVLREGAPVAAVPPDTAAKLCPSNHHSNPSQPV
jgi:hypothetical protein